MAVISQSGISQSGSAGAWFSPTKSQFLVDVDVGAIAIEARRDTLDANPKRLAFFSQTGQGFAVIRGPCMVVVDNIELGRQYRLVPVDSSATASASE